MTDPRTRLAIAAAFFTQALVFITMTTRLPTAQRTWDIDTTQLSLLLLMMVLLSGVGSVAAERIARRLDSAATLRAGLLLVAAAVPLIVLPEQLLWGAAGMAAYGVGLGVVDASTNMQAVALEHRYARPILPSFHGAWTAGGITGAAMASLGLHDSATVAVAVVPLVVAAAPFLAGDRGDAAQPDVAVPWRPILLVGMAMALFYMVDVATQTWGATYAHEVFGTDQGTAARAVLAYLVASGLVRLVGDRIVARFGAVAVLRVGAVVGAAGLGSLVVAPSWPLALVGFALAGAGLAFVAPLSFSAAGRIAGTGDHLDAAARRARVDAVIARFNLFNYAGALLGAVLTGLAGSGDLRWGFLVPAVLVLALVPLARAFVATPGARGVSAG